MPSIADNIQESEERRRMFAAGLVLFDPRVRKYQDPRMFDFHVSGETTLAWKNAFRNHIGDASDAVLEHVLRYKNAVVLFDKENLIGNVIFIPIDNDDDVIEVRDDVVYRKYIKWNPPANMISAIVPEKYKLRVEYASGAYKDITEGITRNFSVVDVIAKLYVMKST